MLYSTEKSNSNGILVGESTIPPSSRTIDGRSTGREEKEEDSA